MYHEFWGALLGVAHAPGKLKFAKNFWTRFPGFANKG